jgi:hypothetical protein
MKINEINQPAKLNEGFLDLLLGPELAATYKKGNKHEEAEKIFINDFVSDATVSLRNGIQAGLIDPDLASSGYGDGTTPTAPTGGTPTAPTGGGPTPPPPTGGSSTAPAPSDAAERGRRARAEVEAREEDHLKALGLKIGDTVTAKVDGKTVTGKVDGAGSYEDQFTFTPSGRFARFMGDDYSRMVSVDDIISKAGTPTRESAYSKLNQIFESIVSEMEDSGVSSIADYMLEWFGLYMEGVNWEARKSVVLPIINDIQSTYKTDQGKAAIEKLARMAFALSGPAKAVPAGAKDAAKDITSGTGTKATGKLTPEQLAAELAALKPIDRDKIIHTVTKAAS